MKKATGKRTRLSPHQCSRQSRKKRMQDKINLEWLENSYTLKFFVNISLFKRKLHIKGYNIPQRIACRTLFLSEKNPALVQNLVYTDRNSCRKEPIISSKAESVESIVSSLATQGNLYWQYFNFHFPQMLFTCLKMLSVCGKTNN